MTFVPAKVYMDGPEFLAWLREAWEGGVADGVAEERGYGDPPTFDKWVAERLGAAGEWRGADTGGDVNININVKLLCELLVRERIAGRMTPNGARAILGFAPLPVERPRQDSNLQPPA